MEMKIRESCLQSGTFIYKPGISVTKQDFHLQMGSLGLQMGFSGYYLPDKYEMKEANRKASINSAFWICFALILENYKKYWSYETISVLFISIMLMFLEKLKQLNNEKNRI